MAEAELRREADILFREMGMSDLPPDTLDFFQNNGSSFDWKKSLKIPESQSTRPRRTSSDGRTLVHLRKKFSTGLTRTPNRQLSYNAQVDSPPTAAPDSSNNDTRSANKVSKASSVVTSGRKISPAGALGSHFGYTGGGHPVSVHKAASRGASSSHYTDKDSGSKVTEESKRRINRSTIAVPVSVENPGSHSNRKLTHTSSAGLLGQTRSMATERRGPPDHDNQGFGSSSTAKYSKSNPPVFNGVHNPVHSKGVQAASSTPHSYYSSKTTPLNATNSSKTNHNGSFIHSSIDGSKLSAVNMRSLTKSKIPERRISDTEGKSSLPTKTVLVRSKTPPKQEDGNSKTQVLYSRKSSFKVVNVSNSSHRILHTVKDGGAPKRHNSIDRGPRPVSSIPGLLSRQSVVRSIRRAPEIPPNQGPRLEKQGHSSQSGNELKWYNSALTRSSINREKQVQNSGTDLITDQKQDRGVYDHLSSPVSASSSAGKEEPVYETIEETFKDPCSPQKASSDDTTIAKKDSTNTNSSNLDPRNSADTVEDKLNDAMKQSYENTPPVKSSSFVSQSSKWEHDVSTPKESLTVEERQEEDSADNRITRYYCGDSNAIYTTINKKKTSSSLPLKKNNDKKNLRRHSADITQSYPGTNTSTEMHRKLHSSHSDASTKSWPSKTPEVSSESDVDQNLVSFTLGSPEPALDQEENLTMEEEILDPIEKRPDLDFNWSQPSTDRTMEEVATSTVEALGTFINALNSDSDKNLSTEGHRTASPQKWYQDSDEDVDSSTASFPLSPISSGNSSHGITSPPPLQSVSNQITQTTRKQSDSLEETGRQSDFLEETRRLSDSLEVTGQETGQTGQTSSTRLMDWVPQHTDSVVDDSIISRLSSDASKPALPPKFKQSRFATSAGKTSNASHSKDSRENSSSRNRDVITDSRVKNHERSISADKGESSQGYKATISDQDSKNYSPDPIEHDYAILEPPVEHDYAILDPEYHEEFYGYCARCSEPVIGTDNGCAALDRIYHLKCFTCSKCGISLTDRNFYTYKDKLLCERDHQVTFEQCYSCKRSIEDRVLKALGNSYHPSCFRCTVCGQSLDGVHYTHVRNKIYCMQDYHKIYGPKCAVCDMPIIPKPGQRKSLRVIAMDKSYHINCYRCEDCRKQLANRTGGGEKCYPLHGHLLCRKCHACRVRNTTAIKQQASKQQASAR